MKVNTTICDKCLSVLDGEEKEDYISSNSDTAEELHFHVKCLTEMSAIEYMNIANIISYYHSKFGSGDSVNMLCTTGINHNERQIELLTTIEFPVNTRSI